MTCEDGIEGLLYAAMTDTTKSIWDNDLPAGDSPPLPRWPLTAAILTYTLWMVFMVVMMILRIKQGT